MFAGKRILLVEDEALIAILLEDMVTGFGATIVSTESQLDLAIARAETEALDGAILDVNLGGQRSFGVADVLRRRGIPFVFATGYGQLGVDPAHRDAPVLMKPYSEDDVARALAMMFAPGQ
jgi:CheY-like chemotaxis protein